MRHIERIVRYLASNDLIIEASQGGFKANKSTHLLASGAAEAFVYHAYVHPQQSMTKGTSPN
jgi:hypothetical protein